MHMEAWNASTGKRTNFIRSLGCKHIWIEGSGKSQEALKDMPSKNEDAFEEVLEGVLEQWIGEELSDNGTGM